LVRKRHPELIDQLEDLYEEFYDEIGRFERNEKDGSVRESSN
jgi:archaellum component FlaC